MAIKKASRGAGANRVNRPRRRLVVPSGGGGGMECEEAMRACVEKAGAGT